MAAGSHLIKCFFVLNWFKYCDMLNSHIFVAANRLKAYMYTHIYTLPTANYVQSHSIGLMHIVPG